MKNVRTKRLKNKIMSSLAAAMIVGMPFMQSLNVAPTAQASTVTSLLGIAGLGMKINAYTRYNYSMPKDLSAVILCRATNASAQHPMNGETGTYSCHVIKVEKDSKYIFPTGYTTGKLTYSGSAGSTQILSLQLGYTLVTGYKDGKAITENGTIPITIQAKISDGTTTTIGQNGSGTIDYGVSPYTSNGGTYDNPYPGGIKDITNGGVNKPDGYDCVEGDTSCTGGGGVVNGGGNTGTGAEGTYNDGHGPCYDGTYFCPEQANVINGGSNSFEKALNDAIKNKKKIPDNGTGTNTTGKIDDGLNTTLPDQKFTDQTDDKTKDYANIISDMLGDNNNNSYGSPDVDWSQSNSGADGGDNGIGNLDDYFNGIEDAGDLPDGLTMTEDYSDVPAEGEGQYYDDGTGQVVYDDGTGLYVEGNGQQQQNNGSGALGDFDGMPAAYQEALKALDGSNGSDSNGNGILGDMGDGSSLKDKLSNILGGDKSVSNNKKGTASDQDLFDYAKKFLLANGYTAADIAAGKNYDAGSAYTEPSAAWDMNRITTLLRGRKISLTSPSEVQEQKSSGESALSRVSRSSLTAPSGSKGNPSSNNTGANTKTDDKKASNANVGPDVNSNKGYPTIK